MATTPQKVQSLRSSVKNTRPTAGTREPGELYTNWADLQLGVISAAKTPIDLIGVRFFSSATNYATGDFVVNGGQLYQAKNAIVAAAFNAADWNKMATPADLALKENTITGGTTAQYWRGDKSWQTLDKAAVGLANVDNTSDVNKPVSTAQATADALKLSLTGGTMSGHITLPTGPAAANAVRKDYVDTADSAATSAINLKADIASPTFTGDPRAPTPLTADSDTSIATTAFVKAQGYLTDSPNDANAYGRKAAAWVDVAEEAPVDSITYGRKNGAWVASVGGAVVSDTAPTPPLVNGQLWWEADSGNTFLWYNDGDSSQWVQQNIQPAVVSNPTAGLTAETRNRLVNPCFQISQENGNTAYGPSGSYVYYAADQWQAHSATATGTMTSQRVQVSTPNGSKNRYRVTVTVADAALAAGDYLEIWQNIEGIRVADFGWGAAGARQIVIRFGWKSPAGTYSIALNNAANTRTYIANFTVTAGQANTDTVQTFVIPGDTTGTWVTDTGVSISFSINIAFGSNGIGVAGWQAGALFVTASNTNGMATAGNVFELYDVGLYLDPDATGLAPKWTMPDEAQELAACQRYFEIAPAIANSTLTYLQMGWKVPKRVQPSTSRVLEAGTAASFVSFTYGVVTGGFYQSVANQSIAQASVTGNARM